MVEWVGHVGEDARTAHLAMSSWMQRWKGLSITLLDLSSCVRVLEFLLQFKLEPSREDWVEQHK